MNKAKNLLLNFIYFLLYLGNVVILAHLFELVQLFILFIC